MTLIGDACRATGLPRPFTVQEPDSRGSQSGTASVSKDEGRIGAGVDGELGSLILVRAIDVASDDAHVGVQIRTLVCVRRRAVKDGGATHEEGADSLEGGRRLCGSTCCLRRDEPDVSIGRRGS